MNVVEGLVSAAENLRDHSTSVAQQLLMSKGPVAWIYNPLEYAWEPHKAYLERFGGLGAKTLLVGMNPGHGMGNTGVPFGCPEKVRDVLKITNLEVKEPAKTHPKRKVYGLSCPKVEISGRRIWGFLSTHFGNAKEIHRHLLVANHRLVEGLLDHRVINRYLVPIVDFVELIPVDIQLPLIHLIHPNNQ